MDLDFCLTEFGTKRPATRRREIQCKLKHAEREDREHRTHHRWTHVDLLLVE